MADYLEVLEKFNDCCTLLRYHVPIEMIEALQYEGSKYSPEFDIGGTPWRMHLQHRSAPQTNEIYLAVHLQCLGAVGAYGHFRLVVCNRDPAAAKAKTFHCHFKKSGSAWGLHHFIPLNKLLNAEFGYINEGFGDGGRRLRSIAIDVVVNVLQAGPDGTYALGNLPPSPKTFLLRGVTNSSQHHQSPTRSASNGYQDPNMLSGGASMTPYTGGGYLSHQQQLSNQGRDLAIIQDPTAGQHIKAPLVFPYEHLDSLCDMSFEDNGSKIMAHRCVIAARMAAVIPEELMPLQAGVVIPIGDSIDVFTAFLRYVYTEDYPEQGTLRPEALLDLYLLGSRCQFYDLCGVCLKFVRLLLTSENILPIVLTKYSIGDEVLNALYLRVLLDNYDALIQDKRFEEIPGHLFRRLSLILREKERLPAVNIPVTKNTLGRQLSVLIETGEYADCDIQVGAKEYIPAHKYILASRSVVYSHAYSRQGGTQKEPIFDGPDNHFSFRSWQKFMMSMYRRSLNEFATDLSAEDIALIFKMHTSMTLDGQLKREAEDTVTPSNALRVMIYAVKHNVTELRDRAMVHIQTNFHQMMRADPTAWELVSELPQPAVVSLFRTISDAQH